MIYKKKKVLLLQHSMDLGGIESSLLGLMDSFDFTKYDVNLFLYSHEGALMPLINGKVKIIPEIKQYKAITQSISKNYKNKYWGIAVARSIAKICSQISWGSLHLPHNYKQFFHKLCLPFLPYIPGEYDVAISFNDPHYIIGKRVDAKVKMSWFHTDASKINFCKWIEQEMWELSDYVVNVSEECKKEFDKKHDYLKNKSIVFENILSESLIVRRSKEINVEREMPSDGAVKLLSIGRFSVAKKFDEIPVICKKIREKGLDVKWYLIGYGGEETLIRKKISEEHMEEFVIILGKKENPYPYIKACDIYLQPSRFEGKSVAVREAQILNKPVIITNYATAQSQLKDGYDGIIIPMDIEGSVEGIAEVIRDQKLQQMLIENTKTGDYTNATEIKKLYRIVEDQ